MSIVKRSAPTAFDGTVFRSRTEARWAVFFKTVGVPYEYEKYSFFFPYLTGQEDIGRSRYTPDFYLPEHHLWIEVKGFEPDMTELAKGYRLARQTKEPVFFYVGFPNARGKQPSGILEVDSEKIVDNLSWGNIFEEGSQSGLLQGWFPFLNSEEDFWKGIEAGKKAFRAPPPKTKDWWKKPEDIK